MSALAQVNWEGLAALLVALVGALTTALSVLIPIYFRERRGAKAALDAIDEAAENGGDARAELDKRTKTDLKLKRHLDGVRNRTRRLEKPKGDA